MATLYAKSQETEDHGQRLGRYCQMIGKRLGLGQKCLSELYLVSKLHDIGKIGIDDSILNKPDKLTAEEWEKMRKHPEIGHRIAMATPQLQHIAKYILYHHERWDGKGYPRELKGEDIPIVSRILAVADAFDAMTEDRVYRKALPREIALAEIKRNAGTQFDPEIAKIFIDLMKDEIPMVAAR
jgi:HD-GYP domain-containing protein (c-di-GMP phosphodiesterase class II)